ncbi:MAG: rhomboid family intramembrane serine protease [Desulfovibrionaceae bacterium]|nr:rhomboid family intramembrane serine protease [Desulfovibrionaceae bacterium]
MEGEGDEKGRHALGEALGRFGRRLFPRREAYLDITGEVFDDAAPGVSEARAREWALVLSARGVPHGLSRDGDLWRIRVPARHAAQAVEEIRAYIRENLAQETGRRLPRPIPARSVAWVMAGLMALFVFLISDPVLFGKRLNFVRMGAGDTGAMLFSGQWWRAVTALTLHADMAHLVGNVAVGGLFMAFLCREAGVGTGFFLALAAGAAGNYLKAVIQGPGHHFLGASTAVFGALGVLGGLRTMCGMRGLSLRQVAPFAAGLMLLALLGAGDEEDGSKIDLAGHFLGFAAGMLLGVADGALMARGWRPGGPATDTGLGLAAALAVLLSWMSAWYGWAWR